MRQDGLDYITPHPLLFNMSADLAGPFKIIYKKRKTWVIIKLCNMSKALHLQLVKNYSVKVVTTALNTVFEVRNKPNTIVKGIGKNVMKSIKLILESIQSGFSNDCKFTWLI